MPCRELEGSAQGDQVLDSCGNICRAGPSLFFAVLLWMLGVHSPPLLNPSIILEWETTPGGEGSDG